MGAQRGVEAEVAAAGVDAVDSQGVSGVETLGSFPAREQGQSRVQSYITSTNLVIDVVKQIWEVIIIGFTKFFTRTFPPTNTASVF